MSLLTYERYVALTGDSTTASALVESSIVDAESEVQEFLRRPLIEGEYTDTLHIDVDGRIYPRAVPVTSIPATANGEIIDNGIAVGFLSPWRDFLVEPYHDPDPSAGYLVQRPTTELTYTGGWTALTAPFRVLRTIARIAYRIANPVALDDPLVGVKSKSVSDASITYETVAGAAAARSLMEELAPGSEAALAGYQWTEDYA